MNYNEAPDTIESTSPQTLIALLLHVLMKMRRDADSQLKIRSKLLQKRPGHEHWPHAIVVTQQTLYTYPLFINCNRCCRATGDRIVQYLDIRKWDLFRASEVSRSPLANEEDGILISTLVTWHHLQNIPKICTGMQEATGQRTRRKHRCNCNTNKFRP